MRGLPVEYSWGALAKISDNGHISTLFFSYGGVIKRDVQQVWEIMEKLTIKDFPGNTSWKSIGGGRRSQRQVGRRLTRLV